MRDSESIEIAIEGKPPKARAGRAGSLKLPHLEVKPKEKGK